MITSDSLIDRAKIAHADFMHRWRWRRTPVARITRRFTEQQGLEVQAGPFAGMRFPKFAVGRAEVLVPQLLGAYEREIQEAIAAAIELEPATIVDVGASDGYYAVGLARACPRSTVHAYEMNFFPKRVCERLAHENGVLDRIVMGWECRVEDLAALDPTGPVFVLSDCEGGEAQLMDPAAVPWLRDARLIVELHEFAVPGVERIVTDRFRDTHSVEIIHTGRRFIADYPALDQVHGVNYMDRELGVSEFRAMPLKWAVMVPHSA